MQCAGQTFVHFFLSFHIQDFKNKTKSKWVWGAKPVHRLKHKHLSYADPDLPEENVPISSKALLITSKRECMLTASTTFSPQI